MLDFGGQAFDVQFAPLVVVGVKCGPLASSSSVTDDHRPGVQRTSRSEYATSVRGGLTRAHDA